MTEYTKNKNSHIMEGQGHNHVCTTKVTVQHNKTYCYRTKYSGHFYIQTLDWVVYVLLVPLHKYT